MTTLHTIDDVAHAVFSHDALPVLLMDIADIRTVVSIALTQVLGMQSAVIRNGRPVTVDLGNGHLLVCHALLQPAKGQG